MRDVGDEDRIGVSSKKRGWPLTSSAPSVQPDAPRPMSNPKRGSTWLGFGDAAGEAEQRRCTTARLVRNQSLKTRKKRREISRRAGDRSRRRPLRQESGPCGICLSPIFGKFARRGAWWRGVRCRSGSTGYAAFGHLSPLVTKQLIPVRKPVGWCVALMYGRRDAPAAPYASTRLSQQTPRPRGRSAKQESLRPGEIVRLPKTARAGAPPAFPSPLEGAAP
jgi:hypothetical protein